MDVWEYLKNKMDYIKSQLWFRRRMFNYFYTIEMEEVLHDLIVFLYKKLTLNSIRWNGKEVEYFPTIVKNACINLRNTKKYKENLNGGERLCENIAYYQSPIF